MNTQRDKNGRFIKGHKGYSGMKGKNHLENAKGKMRDARKGRKPMLGKHHSKKARKKMSLWQIGKKLSLTTRKKMSETQKRIGNMPPHPKGKDCHFWKGGVTPLRQLVRTSFKYRLWRSDVFTRDNFTCQDCGKKGNINAHHINPFALIMDENNIETFEQAMNCEELWNINNGVTLCEECHKIK